MAKDYLGHFYLEYRNAVFTMMFLALENLPVAASPMLLSVIVHELGHIKPPYAAVLRAKIQCAISHELYQVEARDLRLQLGFRGQGTPW